MQLTHEYTQDVENRFGLIAGAVLVFFLIVIARLYGLQVLKGDFYRFFSNENSIKEIKISAPRGMIFDRRGQALVDNRPAFDVVVVPQYVVDPPKVMETLTNLLLIE